MAQGQRIPFPPQGKVHLRDLRDPGVLAWRPRSAFGISARADILTVLATMPGPSISQADLARMARTSKRTIALTLHALALADIVELDPVGNEQRVRLTRHQGFRDWLGKRAEGYTDWTACFAVAASVLRLDDVIRDAVPVVVAIEARALVERLRPSLGRAGSPMAPEIRSANRPSGSSSKAARSASTESTATSGSSASSQVPRTDWLPITRRSR